MLAELWMFPSEEVSSFRFSFSVLCHRTRMHRPLLCVTPLTPLSRAGDACTEPPSPRARVPGGLLSGGGAHPDDGVALLDRGGAVCRPGGGGGERGRWAWSRRGRVRRIFVRRKT